MNVRRGPLRSALASRDPSTGSGSSRAGSRDEGSPRILKLRISYDGTRFVGWQRQAEGTSIQGLIEEALARFEGAPVTVNGAGRTDAGVHALGQVASAQVTCAHPATELMKGLNATLPPEVRIVDLDDAPADFHARFSARSKTYRYLICNAPLVSPFERAYVWHVPERLDIDAMQHAAASIVGRHDFAAFSSTRGTGGTSPKRLREGGRTETKSTVRTMSASGFSTTRWALTSELLAYDVTGDGFLRHMVRAIAGTLVEIGRGRRAADSMAALLTGGTRADAGATAPPHGLFLMRVDYH